VLFCIFVSYHFSMNRNTADSRQESLSMRGYRDIFDNGENAIFVYDAATLQLIDVNQRACEITGYRHEELLSGAPAGRLQPLPYFSNEQALGYLKASAAGEVQRFEWMGNDGNDNNHWFEVCVKPADIDNRACVMAFVRSINDRKLAEEQLRMSELRMRHTLDNMLEGAQIIDYNWKYIYVNDVLTSQAKTTREALLGNTMMECFSGIENTNGFWYYKSCMEERLPYRIENEFTFPDGSVAWFELSIEPVPIGIFILSLDITERKLAERVREQEHEKLEQLVRERTQELTAINKTLESFSYSVSHDLRSPLRAIDGYAQLLEKEYTASLDPEGKRLLSVIRHNTFRMGQLIEDILEFARLGKAPVKKKMVDMNQLVNKLCNDMIQENVAVCITDTLPEAPADASLIAQVWRNLLGNAVKYSSKKDNPQITISSQQCDDETIYSVADNGVGFDMKYADKLFAVFQRLHRMSEFEGTGVGLAIAAAIVQKHGGRIWGEGIPGEGATFYFSLPVDTALT